MATSKEEVKEGKQNEVEAVVTPSIEPADNDISTAVNAATPAEKAESDANKAEAARTRKKRAEAEADKEGAAYPASHNGQNRRISAMLRQSRSEYDLTALRGENRKLKAQVQRMQSEHPQSNGPVI